MREFVPIIGASHVRMFALALLVFVVLGEPAWSDDARPCGPSYQRAIQKAQEAGDLDALDVLRSLTPINIEDANDNSSLCHAWLASDVTVQYTDDLPISAREYWSVTVTIDGQQAQGGITVEDAITLGRRHDIKGRYAEMPDGWGIDANKYESMHLWRTNLLGWLWFKIVTYRGFLLPPALWALFLFAWFGRQQSAEKVAKEFERARREGYEGIFRIGGMRWRLKDGAFWRVLSVIGRTSEDDVIERFDRATRLEQEVEGGWPQLACAIAFPLLADYILFSSGDPGEVVVTRLFGAFFLFSSLWGIIAIYFQRRGHQGAYGAMVLDPAPAIITRKQVAEQGAHGKAEIATEADSHAAASGKSGRRLPVHDQEF